MVMVVDGASSHVAKDLLIPENIRLHRLPGYSPQLNPQEHLWDEIREKEFPNRVFADMAGVVRQLETGLPRLAADTGRVRSITAWPWIVSLNYCKNRELHARGDKEPRCTRTRISRVEADAGSCGAAPRTGLLVESLGLGEAIGVQRAASRSEGDQLGWRRRHRFGVPGLVPTMHKPPSEEERADENEGGDEFERMFHGYSFLWNGKGPAHR